MITWGWERHLGTNVSWENGDGSVGDDSGTGEIANTLSLKKENIIEAVRNVNYGQYSTTLLL